MVANAAGAGDRRALGDTSTRSSSFRRLFTSRKLCHPSENPTSQRRAANWIENSIVVYSVP
jgi:hypothetical protein